MAGTDKTREIELRPGPAIILVRPQLGENIGMAARAMLNCGLTELRIVAPRDGWPNEAAVSAASGADRIVETAKLYDTAGEAVADLSHVYATTARLRGMVKPIVHPREAAREIHQLLGEEKPVGILFGPERTGLENDELVLADRALVAPLNPGFSSLNLAQAVLLCAWEFHAARDEQVAPVQLPTGRSKPAAKALLLEFLERLEDILDKRGFLHPPEKRPKMTRNLRNIFQRADLTDQEVATLQGVVSALIGKKLPPAERDAAMADLEEHKDKRS